MEEIWSLGERKRRGMLFGLLAAVLTSSQYFDLEDRKGVKYLLSPTHEEEITSLVASIVKSFRELPLRLYQISLSESLVLSIADFSRSKISR